MTLDREHDLCLRVGGSPVPPVLEHNVSGASPFLLTCDHYGRMIPDALADLGLPESERQRHIAWTSGLPAWPSKFRRRSMRI